jgi:hypothetical protein
MDYEVQNREGEWVKRPEGMGDNQFEELRKKGKVREAQNELEIEAFGMSEQEARAAKHKEKQLMKGDAGNLLDMASDFAFPISSAYYNTNAEKGEEIESGKMAGALVGDMLISKIGKVAKPLLGKIAPQALKKLESLVPESLAARRAASGLTASQKAMLDSELTQMAINKAEGKGLLDHMGTKGQAVSDGIAAALGSTIGVRNANFKDKALDGAINANKNANVMLMASVPQNIRLNERAGHIIEDVATLGSSKNRNSIQMTKEIFKDPDKPLSLAVAENEAKIAKLLETKQPAMPENLTIETKFIPQNRNMQKSISDNIDLARNELLQDMMDRGYINEEGIVASQVPNIREYLNNSINWNKNQQGITRSAPDEKAARELYTEINKALDANSHIPEVKNLRDWDRKYSESLVEADLLTGISDNRARIDPGNDYYPTRDLDIGKLAGEYLEKDASSTIKDVISNAAGVKGGIMMGSHNREKKQDRLQSPGYLMMDSLNTGRKR